MKKITSLLLLLLAVTTFSCSSSNDDSTPVVPATYYMRFTAGGVASDFADPFVAVSLKTSITGYVTSGNRVTLTIPNSPTVGSHPITDTPSSLTSYSATFSDSNNIDVTGTSGTLTITSIDATQIVGTFNFTGDNAGTPYPITLGSFRAER